MARLLLPIGASALRIRLDGARISARGRARVALFNADALLARNAPDDGCEKRRCSMMAFRA